MENNQTQKRESASSPVPFTPGPWEALGKEIFQAEGPDMPVMLDHIATAKHLRDAPLLAAAWSMKLELEHVRFIILGGDKIETVEPWAQELIDRIDSVLAKIKNNERENNENAR